MSTSLQKRIFGKIGIIVFVIGTMYFSYAHIADNEVVQERLRGILARVSPQEMVDVVDQQHSEHGSITAQDVVLYTNLARKNVDPTLPDLVTQYKLSSSAQAKVDDMVTKGYFEHETPEGYNVEHFIDNAGYEYITVAENLASGDFVDAEDLVTAWMNSPGHRANILNRDVTEIGVAVSYVEFQGAMQYVAVQHFGRPKNSCPEVDVALNMSTTDKESTQQTTESELSDLKQIIDSEGPGSGEYQAHIAEYNAMVTEYNNLSKQIQSDIAMYNESVRAFNACIGTSSTAPLHN